jgi:sugar diacid utilization regulator
MREAGGKDAPAHRPRPSGARTEREASGGPVTEPPTPGWIWISVDGAVLGSLPEDGLDPMRAKPTRLSDELHGLIQRAYRARQSCARIIIADCLDRLPHYRNLPEPLISEVRGNVLHHLTMLYRVTLATGRPLTPEDLEASRQTARIRAAQGVPLGEFLTFFLVGLTRAWEHLIASVGDDPALRNELLDRVSAVISNQTQLMTALTEAYVEEREHQSRFREHDLDDFVQLLLAKEAISKVLEARAVALGIALNEPHTVAIIRPPTAAVGTRASVAPESMRRRLEARLPSEGSWVGRSREGFVAVLGAVPERKALAASVRDLLGSDGRVGVGNPGHGVEGLRRSADEAVRALRIGLTLRGGEPIHTFPEVAVLDLIGIDSEGAEGFMRGVLGSLAGPGASLTYLETLRALAANNFGIKLAAAALSLHPHTVSYRVRQIQQRCHLDLDDPGVRLRVQLALLILDSRPVSTAASGGSE